VPLEPVIEAAGVSKRYGDVQALDGVSVVVDAPATGLLGANGAGKSTFMKSLLGLVRPDAGTIRVLGIDAGHGSRELRVRLGYMPEHDCLPTGMTAHDMVVHLAEMRGLSRRDATLRASEVLFQVGLEEERARLIGTYSTGMKQRAKLAQALVHDPDLVVLDEPTNGLDPAGRVEMISLVRRLSRDLGIKVLLSSHVLEDVERTCDAVVVLRAGQVVAADRIEGMARSEEGTVEVRVAGDAGSLVARLAAVGVAAALLPSGAVRVTGAGDDTLDAVRDAAVDAGVGLRALMTGGPSFEDAVLEAMEG
jgi:ABC-2 type transport system ATP-binding protein